MRSLATKLTLAFLIVGLVGAISVAGLVRWSTRQAFNRFILERDQEILVDRLAQFYQVNGGWTGLETLVRNARGLDERPRAGGQRDENVNWGLFTLLDADKTVIYSLRSDLVGRPYTGANISGAYPIVVEGQTVGWLIQNPIPTDWFLNSPEGQFLVRVTRAAQISAVSAAILALLLGSMLAQTLTRSLRQLKDATEEIASGNLGLQVNIHSQDELGDLGASFNKMSTDLARATQARRQMTADIAHDLRTPLSVISGYTEALSDGKLPGTPEVYEVLHQETLYLNRLIDDLRTLSLADAGELSLNRQPLSPQALLESAAVRHAVAVQGKQVNLQVSASPDLPLIEADPERLSQVFDNLIANALRHTAPGGEIRLSADLVDGSIRLRVGDNGSGIAPEDLPNIFNRFYRGDKSRQSTGESGLGLAISRSIIQAHGGTITVQSQPAQGTEFSILLPVLPAG